MASNSTRHSSQRTPNEKNVNFNIKFMAGAVCFHSAERNSALRPEEEDSVQLHEHSEKSVHKNEKRSSRNLLVWLINGSGAVVFRTGNPISCLRGR